MNFEFEIDSGIDADDIIEYFKEICKDERGHTFMGMGWQVMITRLEDRVHGSIRIPRTHLIFKGDRAVCEKLIVNYRKKFMRGGG